MPFKISTVGEQKIKPSGLYITLRLMNETIDRKNHDTNIVKPVTLNKHNAFFLLIRELTRVNL